MSSAAPVSPPIELKPTPWDGTGGERWARNVDAYEVMLSDIGDALLDRAALVPGLSVVDIGCGGGRTSREIARRVSPGGSVAALDISATLVDLAAARAAADGLDNVRFVTGDAQRAALDGGPFDRVMSRFGIMFFADPAAAFANIRSFLKPGGRADFAVWDAPQTNPGVSALPVVARRHLPLPPADPRAPGPFSLCDAAYFAELLDGAGFGDVAFAQWQGVVHIGGKVGLHQAAAFTLRSASMADIVDDQPAQIRDAIYADLVTLLEPYDRPEGVAVPSSVWLVTASAR